MAPLLAPLLACCCGSAGPQGRFPPHLSLFRTPVVEGGWVNRRAAGRVGNLTHSHRSPLSLRPPRGRLGPATHGWVFPCGGLNRHEAGRPFCGVRGAGARRATKGREVVQVRHAVHTPIWQRAGPVAPRPNGSVRGPPQCQSSAPDNPARAPQDLGPAMLRTGPEPARILASPWSSAREFRRERPTIPKAGPTGPWASRALGRAHANFDA